MGRDMQAVAHLRWGVPKNSTRKRAAKARRKRGRHAEPVRAVTRGTRRVSKTMAPRARWARGSQLVDGAKVGAMGELLQAALKHVLALPVAKVPDACHDAVVAG